MKSLVMLVVATALSCCTLPVMAQDKENKAVAEPDKELQQTAETLLQEIGGKIAEDQWSEVSRLMTDTAWDSWCERMVVDSLSLAKLDLQFGIPELEAVQDAMQEVLEQHGLDKIELHQPSIDIHTGDDSLEENKPDPQDEQKQTDEIMKALAATDRNAVMGDLWRARSASPLGVSVFSGKVTAVHREGDALQVTVQPARPETDSDQPGLSVMIVVPPVVIDLVQVEDEWKYAGVNEEKTEAAGKNFRPPSLGGERSDF